LEYLLQVRQFALQQLPLPDNQSYLDYVQMDRDYVTWNVFATGELSMNNLNWCFPIAGCVSYRGYFDRTDAEAYAQRLAAQGYDTYTGGAGAYSTLGWFDDPVLSTFLEQDRLSLAALLFHELAHQVLYVAGDTEFNESFATTIEQVLLDRWININQQLEPLRQPYQNARVRQDAFTQLVLRNKAAREQLFVSDQSDAEKRAAKQKLIAQMQQDYQQFRQQWHFDGYDDWIQSGLNNAQLSTIAAYHGLVPGLKKLYEQNGEDLQLFIDQCRQLAALDQDERQSRLR